MGSIECRWSKGGGTQPDTGGCRLESCLVLSFSCSKLIASRENYLFKTLSLYCRLPEEIPGHKAGGRLFIKMVSNAGINFCFREIYSAYIILLPIKL